LFHRGRGYLVEDSRNSVERLARKNPNPAHLAPIHPLDHDVEITVGSSGSSDSSHQIFVRPEWVAESSIRVIADFVDPSRKSPVEDHRKLVGQHLRLFSAKRSI